MAPWTSAEEAQKMEDAMKSAKECMRQLNQNVLEDFSTGTMSAISRKCFETFESLFHGLATKEQRSILGDFLSDKGVAMVFVRYAKSLRQDRGLVSYNGECFDVMRRVFWYYTDASEKLRIECGKTRVLTELTLDLDSHRNNIEGERGQVPEVISASLGILHNCVKAEDNLPYFAEADAVRVLRPYSEQEKYEVIQMLAVLTLSYVMNENDKESVGKTMIDFTLKSLQNALQSSDHRFNGFSAEELVDGLSHMVGNDKNKILILESDLQVLDILADLMENGSAEEKRVCVDAVWALSFAKDNKISSHPKIIPLLEEIKNSTLAFQDSAEGVLWGLRKAIYSQNKPPSKTISEVQGDSLPIQPEHNKSDSKEQNDEYARTKDTADNTDKKHIMISYNWDSAKATARKIYDRLCELQYRVWIDVEHIESSFYDSMAKAVENSAVFIMCMSKKYKDSNNCQLEAKYAQHLKVPTRLVLAEPGYKPDGWLGLIGAGELYVDLSSDDKFEKNIQELVKLIGKNGKRSDDDPVISPKSDGNRPCQRESRPQTLPVEEWSAQDVNDWAKSNSLKAERFQDLDGECLAFLRKIKETNPSIFYQYAAGQADSSYIRNLMKLCNAIDELDKKSNT